MPIIFILILISSIAYGQFVQQAKLVSSDAANQDQLGYNGAVGIDGDYAVIGTRYDDDGNIMPNEFIQNATDDTGYMASHGIVFKVENDTKQNNFFPR